MRGTIKGNHRRVWEITSRDVFCSREFHPQHFYFSAMDPTYFVPVSPAVKLLIPLDFVLLPVQALNPELLRPFYPQSLMVLSFILQVMVRENVGKTFFTSHNILFRTITHYIRQYLFLKSTPMYSLFSSLAWTLEDKLLTS